MDADFRGRPSLRTYSLPETTCAWTAGGETRILAHRQGGTRAHLPERDSQGGQMAIYRASGPGLQTGGQDLIWLPDSLPLTRTVL